MYIDAYIIKFVCQMSYAMFCTILYQLNSKWAHLPAIIHTRMTCKLVWMQMLPIWINSRWCSKRDLTHVSAIPNSRGWYRTWLKSRWGYFGKFRWEWAILNGNESNFPTSGPRDLEEGSYIILEIIVGCNTTSQNWLMRW